MKRTTSWYCDTCGRLIRNAAQGNVEWLIKFDETGRAQPQGLRLVHHCKSSPRGALRCDYHHHVRAHPDTVAIREHRLEALLGDDGITRLLELIKTGEAPPGEVIRLFMRLYTPGYERARRHLDHAIATGVIKRRLSEGFHTQAELAAVLDFARAGA